MEKDMDPNIPDRSNGGYFCRLCLIEANSEHVWAIHVAGKRHYRNLTKYPNGIALRQMGGIEKDSFETPAKYRRYENDEWSDCSSEANEYYTRRNYRQEIKPQVIDYDHKKGFSDVVSAPVSKTLDDITMKEKHENPLHELFQDEKYEQLEKYFKEKISKVQSDGMEQNIWNSNKAKPQKTLNSNKVKPPVEHSPAEDSSDEDEFEKELDKLLKNSSDSPKADNKAFSSNRFKRNIEDLLSGNSSKKERKDKELKIKDTPKVSNKTKIQDDTTSMKKREAEDKMKSDRVSFKKKSRKTTPEEDFIDMFHKMNDEKIFEMSAADEEEDIYLKKPSKTADPKLDDIDPDKLTTDVVDNLLSSYMKTKADSSKSKESSESCAKNSHEANTKEDDLDTFSKKLESLPTKAFFQIILTRLKTLDLKDSDELQMVLDVISQAQEVVCKKLPPHLLAVIKAKMAQNSSTKTTPPLVQYPTLLPRTESGVTTFSAVSKIDSRPTLPTQSTPTLNPVSQSVSQEVVKSVSQPVSSMSSHSVQTPISSTASSSRIPSFLNNLDSFQSMIAWQNYLSSKGTAAEKTALKSANAVQATLAYQNYLSKLQANATTAKTTSEKTASLNSCSTSNASLSSPNSKHSITHAISKSDVKSQSTSKSVHPNNALKNILSTLQAAMSNTVSQTLSSSVTKPASTLDSSPKMSVSRNSAYVSQRDRQTVSSTAEIPSNTASYQNQAAAQNFQTYYQQYAMHLQRMSGQYAKIASLATSSKNVAGSQPKSHSNSTESTLRSKK